jgi:GTP diphosphokinase / guanosine-3',5'-bis(diphosphate) 3'-diphosphatase
MPEIVNNRVKAVSNLLANNEVLNKYRGLLRVCRDMLKEGEVKLIRKAFDTALKAHHNQKRDSGEPYIFHSIQVARIVVEELGLGTTSVIAALIHETLKEKAVSQEEILKQFGPQVANIVTGLTKIAEISTNNPSKQAENFKKLILTFSTDIRVIFIKLADRLDNMRNLDSSSKDKQFRLATETFYLYAPLAHRMGFYNIKSEMEDLSLKYTEPKAYNLILHKLKNTTTVRNKFIKEFTDPIKEHLALTGLNFQVKSRTKSVYSIWNKMKKQQAEFEEIYDLFAIRVILKSDQKNEKADCWKVYSVVTDLYQPNTERLRDWISVPKTNGYESLHTTVVGPGGKFVEVQIRSERMDEVAEKGLAAHWKYKGEKSEKAIDTWLSKVREVLETPDMNSAEFLDSFKMNLYDQEIFVFTPKGDLKRFPAGASVLDFAFDIHTNVGSQCTGAKVNNKNVTIKHILKSGDQVSILTSKNQKPKIDWLNHVITSKARAKIKQTLNEEKLKEAEAGKELLMRRLKNWKLEFNDINQQKVLKHFRLKTATDLYYLLGTGKIDPSQIKDFMAKQETGLLEEPQLPQKKIAPEKVQKPPDDILIVDDKLGNVQYKFAKCCNPVYGDSIFGFVTVKEGIKIHRTNCPNAPQIFSRYGYRVVKTKWSGYKEGTSFQALIKISGVDDVGIINRISDLISKELKMNMRSINVDSKDGLFSGFLRIQVDNTSQIDYLINKLLKIKGVQKAVRFDSN